MSNNKLLEEEINPNALLAEPEEKQKEEETTTEKETESEEEAITGQKTESKEEITIEETGTIEELTTETLVEEKNVSDNSENGNGLLFLFIGFVIAFLLLSLGVYFMIIKKKKYTNLSEVKEIAEVPCKNKSSVKIMKTAKNCPVKIASIHDMGKRSSQQDSFGISDVKEGTDFENKGVLAIVADGMGGLSDGDRMSQMVVVTMLKEFDKENEEMPDASLLLKLVNEASAEVLEDLGEEKTGRCGSTVTAVIVKNNILSWISVGDSHIYVYRKGKLVKMNKDHNYAADLDAMVENGELTPEEAMNDPQRSALTSFIGMGNLELVDQNENPVALEKGDRILLMSDGIFGTVSEIRIAEIMAKPLPSACEKLEAEIKEVNKQNQDNYTCVILEMK